MHPGVADLQRFHELLTEGLGMTDAPGVLLEHATMTHLVAEVENARRSRDELDAERIVVGLLGGTGVGKSTLLNAVAGAAISNASHRRPTTDRVVCYTHADFPIPEGIPAEDLADSVGEHALDALRGVTILDLPDIDSRKPQHRDRVHRVLPHLDLLLVVTSVEKYADLVLYEELAALPQSPKNLVFIVNAVDRIDAEQEHAVTSDFETKLAHHAQVGSASIIPLSALRSFEDEGYSGRGHLQPLRRLLEELGGDEGRQRVLAANLDASLQRIGEMWTSHVPAESMQSLWKELAQISPAAPAKDAGAVEAVQSALERVVAPWLKDRAQRSSWFPIGPAYFFCRKLRWFGAPAHVADPFDDLDAPVAALAERFVSRPIGLAHRRAQRALEPMAERVRLELPRRDPEAEPDEDSLGRWVARLRRRGPRLGWKLRPHLLPGFLLAALIGNTLVRVVPEDGGSWWAAAFDAMQAMLLALSPTALLFGFLGLVLYYLAVYPYFLYRLERAVHAESAHGAALYLEAWGERFEKAWSTPFAATLDSARDWWRRADAAFRAVAREKAAENQPQP